MEVRQDKAIELVDRNRVVRHGGDWNVFSLTSAERYFVRLKPRFCSCPDFELRQADCKHLLAVRLFVSRESSGVPAEQAPALVPPIQWPRKTYAQDWPNYDAAQHNEKAEFTRLLSDLCGTLADRPANPKGGGSFAPLADLIFAAVYKIYAGISGRRFATDLRDAAERGYVSRAVHHATIAKTLEDPETTPILTGLVEASARPFAAIEDEFAVDSSGFSASKFDRWYSLKYGRLESEHAWVKCHALTGTTTHAIIAAVVGPKDSADTPEFAGLVRTAAEGFRLRQVSADRAYPSRENFQAVADAGGTAYIAFKSNATGEIGGVYAKMYHLFCLNKDEYLHKYHRRSNIESTFGAVKRLMGDSVRSRSDVAMRNEVLGKLLAYNITCLVHAIYELGLDPAFGEEPALPAILKFPGAG